MSNNFDPNAIEFDDPDAMPDKSGMTFKELVMKSFNMCVDAGSKEMTIGGIQKRLVNGEVKEVTVPNQPEIFMNSIKTFKTIVVPTMVDNPEIKKQVDDINKRLKELEAKKDAMIVALLPKSSVSDDFMNYQHRKSDINEEINNIENQYQEAKIDIYREMLEILSFWLYEKNYFEEQGYSA